MKLASTLLDLVSNLVPTKTRTIVRGHQQLPALAQTLDVDAIHGILREAEAGHCARLFALYRDVIAGYTHLQSEFAKRKLAVIADPLTLISADPDNATLVKHDKEVETHLVDLPGWVKFLSHSLDSTLYPVSISERIYSYSDRPGWRFEISGLEMIPADHLAWPYGELSLRETDASGNFTGQHIAINSARHVIHRGHLLTSVPDWWGGPMRAVLFWWFFATCDRDWWARFLDRFGSPFLEGRYDSSDERGRYELESAFSAATKLFGIVVSNDARVAMHQANTSQGGDAFEKFAQFANREVSKLVVGQTSSAEIQQAGLNGGGQGKLQGDVRDDIRRFDAYLLAHAIKTQILIPLWRLNGWLTPIPTVAFGSVDAEETEITADLLVALKNSGIALTDDGLSTVSKRLGLSLRFDNPSSLPTPGWPLSARPLRPPAASEAQARRAAAAVSAIAAASAPKIGRLVSGHSRSMTRAILDSPDPESAANEIASILAGYDPTAVADLYLSSLDALAANGVFSAAT